MPEAVMVRSENATNVSSSSVSFEIRNPQAQGCVLSSLAYLRYRVSLHSTRGGIAVQAGQNITAANTPAGDGQLPMFGEQARNGVGNTGIALGDGFPI